MLLPCKFSRENSVQFLVHVLLEEHEDENLLFSRWVIVVVSKCSEHCSGQK